MIYRTVNILLTKIQGFKTSMLRSDLCDYSDVYNIVKGIIIVTGTDNANIDRSLPPKSVPL